MEEVKLEDFEKELLTEKCGFYLSFYITGIKYVISEEGIDAEESEDGSEIIFFDYGKGAKICVNEKYFDLDEDNATKIKRRVGLYLDELIDISKKQDLKYLCRHQLDGGYEDLFISFGNLKLKIIGSVDDERTEKLYTSIIDFCLESIQSN